MSSVSAVSDVDDRAATISRLRLFHDSRVEQAEWWAHHNPHQRYRGFDLRTNVVPLTCGCEFCQVFLDPHLELLLGDVTSRSATPCDFEVWGRCMRAAGLPLRPYDGERGHLEQEAADLEQEAAERAADEARAAERRHLLNLYEQLEAIYDVPGEWRHPVRSNVPFDVSTMFSKALKEGNAETFLVNLAAQDGVTDKHGLGETDKHVAGVADKVLPPGEEEAEQVVAVAAPSIEANNRGPRLTTAAASTTIRRRRTKKRTTVHPAPYPRRGKGFVRSIYTYMTRIGHPMIDSVVANSGAKPTVDDLAEALFDKFMNSTSSKYIVEPDSSLPSHVATSDTVWTTATAAAEFLLVEWNPEYRRQQADKGRRGGLNSIRPKDVTVGMLLAVRDAHPGVTLTVRQEADLLDTTERTVQRRRADLRAAGVTDKVQTKNEN